MGEGGARSPELAGLVTAGAVAAAEGVCVRVGRRGRCRRRRVGGRRPHSAGAPTPPHSGRTARSGYLVRSPLR